MTRTVAAGLLLLAISSPTIAQQPSPPEPAETGWEWFGLPTLNFNSDEGFGYGALLQLYNYGNGAKPYRFMIRPVLLVTTKGRRDFTIEFDAPRLLPPGWRLDAFVGREQHLATPYYGIGNETIFDESLEAEPDVYYYRYGRTQLRVAANVQREVSRTARLLAGAQFAKVTTDPTPFDSGTTLFAQDVGPIGPAGNLFLIRSGVVLDTRDREIGPRRGHWVDALVQHSAEKLGSARTYTRYTFTGRKYVSLTDHLVFAQRLVGQVTDGAVPIFDISTLQTVAGQSEALGGNGSVRGISKNRFIGRSVVASNSELRYRTNERRVFGKPAYLVLSGFFDTGRVWTDGIDEGELLSDYHAGYGGGVRLGLGPSFLIAFDLGRSSESTQIYIGLGYPF